MDGSATAYMIEFTDYMSGNSCISDTISAWSCRDGLCNYSFIAEQSSPCFLSMFNGLSVTIIAENLLGNGPKSDPLTILVPQIDGIL